MSELDNFKMQEIENYSMNWETGKMTHTFINYKTGEKETEVHQAVEPKSPMYYAFKRRENNEDI